MEWWNKCCGEESWNEESWNGGMNVAVRSHSCRYDFPPKQRMYEKQDYKESEPKGLKRQMERDLRELNQFNLLFVVMRFSIYVIFLLLYS